MSDNRLELKNKAFLERISNLTANYENQVAELRVELTLLSQQLDEANKELTELRRVREDAEMAANERATSLDSE
jgi:chaperonin cofactor prefoldin